MMHPTTVGRKKRKMYRKYTTHQKRLHQIHLAEEETTKWTNKKKKGKKTRRSKAR
jgi:hypothetical protein